jgi:hypothetical protein
VPLATNAKMYKTLSEPLWTSQRTRHWPSEAIGCQTMWVVIVITESVIVW